MQAVKGKCLVWLCREVHGHRIEGIANVAITHHNHLQIICRAWHWLRVSPGKIIVAQIKTALHRSRLQVLFGKNFQFCFSTNHAVDPRRC